MVLSLQPKNSELLTKRMYKIIFSDIDGTLLSGLRTLSQATITEVKLLNENILLKGAESMRATLDKHQLSADDITYFLPHISSCYFKERLYEALKTVGIDLPLERWFINLPEVGNVGSASAYLMLEALMHSGKLKTGDTVLLSVPESGRFSFSCAFLRVV